MLDGGIHDSDISHSSSSSTTQLFASFAERWDAPSAHVKRIQGDFKRLSQEVSDDPDSKRRALDDYESDKFAKSTLRARDSQLKTLLRMHTLFFGDDTPAFPLKVHIISGVASMFKKGRYTSYANYLSRTKAEHEKSFRQHGTHWTHDFELESKESIRSVTRGMAPSRQSPPFDLR